MRPGQVERRTHDYTRHGTLTLFAALDAATGKVIGRCYPPHRGREFLSFLREIERSSAWIWLFFVDANNQGVFGRRQIKPDDIAHLSS